MPSYMATSNEYKFVVGNKGVKIADPVLFKSTDADVWNNAYRTVQNPKYKIGKRKYSKKIVGRTVTDPKIYCVPRRRGQSYKTKAFKEVRDNSDLYYCEASKGYRFGDLSSFAAGPIVGHGINVLSAVWSKRIFTSHIEGGHFDITKPNFWAKPDRASCRRVEWICKNIIKVDGDKYTVNKWLKENMKEWYGEWKNWSEAIALCGEPTFKWMCNYDCIAWVINNKVRTDSKQCWFDTYVTWLYGIWDNLDTYSFVEDVMKVDKKSIVLVHPMLSIDSDEPITRQVIHDHIDSGATMCAPYCLMAKLLGMKLSDF